MADEVDVLLRFCEDEWTQSRQSESQRSTITSYVITISGAVLAFIGHKGLSVNALPLAVFLFVLGIYGAMTCEKLYERWLFHRNRVRHWRKRIDELRPDANLLRVRDEGEKAHRHILRKVRLHWLWLVLHLLVAGAGLACFVVIVARMG